MGLSEDFNAEAFNTFRQSNYKTGEELMTKTFTPIKYVLPNYIVEGVTIVGGKPKIGKSWWVLDIAIGVATGGVVLGEQCIEGDVLYCALEDNERRLQDRIKKLNAAGKSLEHFAWTVDEMPRLHQGGIEYLKGWIQQAANPRLIVIDTLTKVRPPLSNNQSIYEADYRSVECFRNLANEYNVAIIIVHHLRKMQGDDVFDDMNGSLGLTAAADSTIILKRKSTLVELHAQGRDIPPLESVIEFNMDTFRWNVIGNISDVLTSQTRKQIIDVLNEEGKSMTPKEIASAIGANKERIAKMLQRMAKDGAVTNSTYGKYQTAFAAPTNRFKTAFPWNGK